MHAGVGFDGFSVCKKSSIFNKPLEIEENLFLITTMYLSNDLPLPTFVMP